MSKESEEYQKEYVKFDALLQKHGYQNSFEAALEYADHQTTQLKIELGEKDKKLILFNNDLNTERDRANRNRSIIDDIQKKDGETIALLADKYAEAKKENDINNKLIQAKDIVISTHERINIDLSNQLTASEARVKELEETINLMSKQIQSLELYSERLNKENKELRSNSFSARWTRALEQIEKLEQENGKLMANFKERCEAFDNVEKSMLNQINRLNDSLTASEARVKELEKILKSMLTIYEKYANDDPYEDEIVNYANKLISGTKQ